MRKFLILAAILLLAAALLLPILDGGSPQTEKTTGKISAAEGKALLEDTPGMMLVDVRGADEYEAGHIPGAILIPNESIGDQEPAELPDHDAPIIVYCRTGVRSAEAAKKLADLGYTAVYDMGGIQSWPYETAEGSEPGQGYGQSGAGEGGGAPDADGGASGADPGEGDDADDNADDEKSGILSEFTALNLTGQEIDQSILADHDLTMVNVWATYCPSCIDSLPSFAQLQEDYGDSGLQIIGIVSDTMTRDGEIDQDQVDKAQELVDDSGAAYPQLTASTDLVNLVLYQIQYIPTTFFVDSQGRQVGSAYIGARDMDTWREAVEAYLLEVQS